MRYVKSLLVVILCIGFFFYGMISLEYKYFPYSYIVAVKQQLTHTQNRNQSAEVMNTFFQRLLIKKVFIDEDLFKGGAIENLDPYIFIITNKGKLLVYETENYSEVALSMPNVPMNLDELLLSDLSEREDFRLEWFRVSGIHAEYISQNELRLFVAHHSFNKSESCVDHKISSTRLRNSSGTLSQIESWATIFTADPCIKLEPDHYSASQPFVGHLGGGKMIEHNDSTLMVTVGEYDRNGLNNTEAFSQDPTVPYGKIILVDKVTGEWSVYASGLRNALGLFKSENGVIWETENGPRGGDELNIITKGSNYGWPEVSYGVWYLDEYRISGDHVMGTHKDFQKPVYAWVPSIAPNNLVKIEGKKFKTWNGDLIVGTMRDQSLYRIRLSDNNEVIYTEKIYLGHRVRDMIVLDNETIAIITDDGFLIILDDGGSVFSEMNSEILERQKDLNRYDGFTSKKSNDEADRGKKSASLIFQEHCSGCHFKHSKNSIGPHLNNLFQREVGSLKGFNYSTSLMNDNRTWNPGLLRDFLMEPYSEFPDNQMSKVELTPAEVDSIISYLK